MAESLGALQVTVGADIANFEAGMNQVQADLGKVAAAADAAAGRYVDAQGRMRDASGRFVSAATLAAEAAARAGGSIGTLGDVTQRTATTINGGLVSSFGAFDKAIKPLNEGIGRLGEGIKSVGSGLTTYVTIPLGLMAAGALAAFGKIDSLSKGLNALSTQDVAKEGLTGLAAFSAAAARTSQRLQELQEIAKAPGIGFEEAVKGDIRLRAVGISAGQSAKVLKEFANAIALTGGGATELNSVTVQLAQLSAKGKVLAQDLRPVIEAAPAVSQALIKLYGTVDSETISASLAKQGKSSQDFIATLTDTLAELPRVGASFTNALENFQQGAVQNAAAIGDSLNKAFNLQGLLDTAGRVFDGLTQKFVSLDPATQKLVFGLAAAAAAAGPVVFGLGAIVAAIPSVVAGLEVLGLASTAALGPLGIGVAAVAAAAFLIIDHWDELTAYFSSSGEGGRVFADLADSVGNSISQISEAFSALNGGGDFGDLVSAVGILKAAFRDVAVGITAVSNVIGGTIGTITSLLSGDLPSAARQAETALIGLIQPLANVLGFQLRLAPATEGVKEKFDALSLTLPGLAANLAALNTPFPVANIAGGADAITKQVGLLEALKQRLKDVKDQRDKETAEGAIFKDNAIIKALEKEIARLEQSEKAGKKATDAITKLRQELARLTALDNLLGNTPSELEVLERRADTLQKGLKTLVDAGVSTSSKAFQGFAADLVKTSQAADKLKDSALGIDFKPAKITGLIPTTLADTVSADVARLLGDLGKKPIELPLKVLVKVNEVGFTTNPTKALNDALINFGRGMKDVSAINMAFGSSIAAAFGGFDTASEKIRLARAALQDLLSQGFGPADPYVQSFVKAIRKYNVEAQSAQIVSAGLSSAFAGLGNSIGQSLASGGDVLEAAGRALLKSLAEIGAQYGQFLIALGIADVATGFASAKGVAEIAAGTALIAASGLLGAFATGGGASAASGGISAPKTSYNSSAAANQQQLKVQVQVVGTITGRAAELSAVLRSDGYRVLRTN
jgi:tape measure domain-containing protein